MSQGQAKRIIRPLQQVLGRAAQSRFCRHSLPVAQGPSSSKSHCQKSMLSECFRGTVCSSINRNWEETKNEVRAEIIAVFFLSVGHSTHETQRGFAGEGSKQPRPREQQNSSEKSEWEPKRRKCLTATVTWQTPWRRAEAAAGAQHPAGRDAGTRAGQGAAPVPHQPAAPSHPSAHRGAKIPPAQREHRLCNTCTYCHILAFNLKGN